MESSPAEPQPEKVNVSRKPGSAGPTVAPPARNALLAFWERHGNRILLGLTLVALLYAALQYKRGADRRALESSWDGLEAARKQVGRFRSLDIGRLPPDQIVAEAAGVEGRVAPALDAIAEDTDHPSVATQALVTRGDLYWTLANLPSLATESTTQPTQLTQPTQSTQPTTFPVARSVAKPGRTPEEYLTRAEGSYKRAVQLNGDAVSVAAARMGLAAIAENRGQWDDAKRIYDALTADANVADAVKTLARGRLAILEQIRRPLFTTPTTRPVVSTTSPTTGPMTR